jgi:hypothetical protein
VEVTNLAKSLEWYQRLFGRKADATPMPEVVVMIKDPDGNSIAFAEAIDRNMAR